MATPSTLNESQATGESAQEPCIDEPCVDEGYASVQSNKKIQCKDEVKMSNSRPHITDFFAYSSLVDEDDMNQNQQIQILGNYEEKDEGTTEADKVTKFFRMFPKRTILFRDVCFKITPAIGAVCYEYFSLSVMDPTWFYRAFGESENAVKNAFWSHAHLGCGLYIFSRQHIRKVPVLRALFYSTFGSMIFNFGSLMIWGWGCQLLPESPIIRSAFGLLSGGALLYAAQDYLQCVDNSCSEVD